MAAFRFIDLFAGIGGFHHALAGLGGDCVLAVELDEACRRVYASSHPGTPLVADIRSITRVHPDAKSDDRAADEIARIVPDHDVLCAGFPCQPFSKSGFQHGVRDRTRGTLFFDVMSIILAKQPRFVLLENVRNLAGPRHADTWSTIVESLRDAGYRVADDPVVATPHLLAPNEGGAPQVRDRVFVLAERLDCAPEEARRGPLLVAREPTPGWDPRRWRIADLLDPDEAIPNLDAYSLRPQEVGWIEAWQAFSQQIPSDWLPGFPIWEEAFRLFPNVPDATPHWKADFLRKNSDFYRENKKVIDSWRNKRWGPLKQRVSDFPPSRRKFEWQARSAQPLRHDRDLSSLVLHMRPSGIRVKAATYLPALVAITQTSVIGPKVGDRKVWRRITPREAARLQGIPPDTFSNAGVPDAVAYKQLGNAVNVGVVRHVAQALFASGALEASGSLAIAG